MKKYLLYVLTLIMSVALISGLAACGNDDNGEQGDPSTTYSYVLNKTSLTLEEGSSEQLTVTVTPTKEISPEFSSSAESVATVSENGTVTAVKKGTATINVKVDDKTLTCSVTVTEKKQPPSETTYEYVLNTTRTELKVEETKKLTVTVDPEKAISPTFTSDNTEVATVDVAGLITAVAPGEATVTVNVDGKTLTCKVIVSAKPIVYNYEISESSLSLGLGETQSLSVTVTPEPETAPVIVWSSDKENIATVDTSGLVKAVGAGTAVITAKVDGNDLTCEVTVTSPVSATASLIDSQNKAYNFKAEDPDYGSLYYEYYNYNKTVNVTKSADNNTYVPQETNGVFAFENGFWDYNTYLAFIDSSDMENAYATRSGVHSKANMTDVVSIKLNVTSEVKAIRLFTAAWNATNTTSLWYNGVCIASAEPFTAGGTALAKIVEFAINYTGTDTMSLEIRITPSNVHDDGNNGVAAIEFMGAKTGTAKPAATVTTTVNMSECYNGETLTANLDEVGNLDWYVPKGNHRNSEGSAIKVDTFDRHDATSNGGNDYRYKFVWSGNAAGTRDFYTGHMTTFDVNITSLTKKVTLYVGSWMQCAFIGVFDSNGNMVGATSYRGDGSAIAEFNVSTQTAQTLTFILLGTNTDDNIWLGAIAVSGIKYTLSSTAAEIKDNETKQLNVTASDGSEFTAVWDSSDKQVATVDNKGLVTAVAVGETDITAKIGDITLTCKLTVTSSAINYVYSLNKTSLNLGFGDVETLQVVVTPQEPAVMPTFNWVTSNDKVATVVNGKVTAVGAGSATITLTVDGVDEPITCAVVVTPPPVTVTAALSEITANTVVDMNASDDNYSTLYAEHYNFNSGAVRTVMTVSDKDYVPDAKNGVLSFANGFGDYKACMSLVNATSLLDSYYGTAGVHSKPNNTTPVSITVIITSEVKAIRVFTGAWRATNTLKLFYKGVAIATAETFTAGEEGLSRLVEFTVNYEGSEDLELEIVLNPTDIGTDGNNMLVAIQLLKDKVGETASSVVATKGEEYPDGNSKDPVNLDTVGTLDWFVPASGDRKSGGSLIKTDSFNRYESNRGGGDFRVQFTWDGKEGNPERRFWAGQYTSFNVEVTSAVKKITVYGGAWEQRNHIYVIDASGNILTSIEVNAQGYKGSQIVEFDVSNVSAQTLTFFIIGKDFNVWLGAIAVSGEAATAPANYIPEATEAKYNED